jgi:CheY-like chemotaxis protein
MVIETQKSARPVRILLVEDDLGDANLTIEAFKESKIPVDLKRAADGEDALTYLRKEGVHRGAPSPDLVLLDLNMPRKTGLEVLDEIKSDPNLTEIPVLVLTCSKSDADIRRAYEAKANFYIVKPTDLHEFYAAMKYVEEIWLKGVRNATD